MASVRPRLRVVERRVSFCGGEDNRQERARLLVSLQRGGRGEKLRPHDSQMETGAVAKSNTRFLLVHFTRKARACYALTTFWSYKYCIPHTPVIPTRGT